MRIVNWLFIVSAALFISGIGFIIASARTKTPEASVVQAAPVTPVATVKQIMGAIVMPAAYTVFDSVATIVSAAGVEEKQPRTDEEWAVVGAGAAALIEASNLLVMGDRAVDREDWVKMSKAMADAGMMALKAADAKNPEGILAAGETINKTCDDCHQKYQR
jgi:hypothetical protein